MDNNENKNEFMMFVIFIFLPFFKGFPRKRSKLSNFSALFKVGGIDQLAA